MLYAALIMYARSACVPGLARLPEAAGAERAGNSGRANGAVGSAADRGAQEPVTVGVTRRAAARFVRRPGTR
jgi:hypothetical protein